MVWGAGNEWTSGYASPIPATVFGKRRVFVFTGGESFPATGGPALQSTRPRGEVRIPPAPGGPIATNRSTPLRRWFWAARSYISECYGPRRGRCWICFRRALFRAGVEQSCPQHPLYDRPPQKTVISMASTAMAPQNAPAGLYRPEDRQGRCGGPNRSGRRPSRSTGETRKFRLSPRVGLPDAGGRAVPDAHGVRATCLAGPEPYPPIASWIMCACFLARGDLGYAGA